MDRKYITLYDEFTHGGMGRREFLKRLAALAGGVAAAYALLPMLENDYAQAATVAAGDGRLATHQVEWDGAKGKVRGYLAHPKARAGKLPAVVVIHENRGLNPHIQDVARRAALAGYLALAPDGLSATGGTPENGDQARELFQKLDPADSLRDFLGAVDFAATREASTGKVGCVGFCWGGGMANRLAVASDRLAAAVAFYGRQAPIDDVPRIRAALQLHYAERDERINAGIKAYAQALNAARTRYELYMYAGTEHAFHNDTSQARYSAEAAGLAWARTLDFFKQHLG
jgi:carboxymethylenebutenolidase